MILLILKNNVQCKSSISVCNLFFLSLLPSPFSLPALVVFCSRVLFYYPPSHPQNLSSLVDLFIVSWPYWCSFPHMYIYSHIHKIKAKTCMTACIHYLCFWVTSLDVKIYKSFYINILSLLNSFILFLWNRAPLWSPGHPGTCSADKDGFELRRSVCFISASPVLGLKACSTTTQLHYWILTTWEIKAKD